MSAEMTGVTVTFFENFAAKTKSEETLSLDEIERLIREATAHSKAELPWIKLARFGNIKTNKGSLRHDANVIAITGIEGDYDGEEIGFEGAVEIAEKAGLLAIIYTSPSHTAATPRWRLMCPISGELPPDQRRCLMARLNGLYCGIFAAESWALSQAYYFGSVNRNPNHRVEIVGGEFIDRLDGLDRVAIDKPAVKKATAAGNGADGSSIAIALEDLGGWARELITQGESEGQGVRQRGKQFFEIVKYLHAKDYAAAQVIELLARHPGGVAGKYDGRLETEVNRVWEKLVAQSAAPKPSEVIEEFNARYAVVNEAGKAMIYEQTDDPILGRKVLIRIGFSDLQKFYQNRPIQVGDDVTTAANYWLKSPKRRQYLGGVVFDPTGNAPADCWNLWSGFAVEPRQGDWSLMREHIRDVICAGDDASFEYVLNWTARLFQKPNRPGEVALVLRGLKGVGKGIFFQYLRKAWGQHGLYISNPKHLVGNFNAHLRDCVFLFADEAFFAGDRQHESVLKALVTDPVIPVEGKYQNVITVPNMLHVGMASNAEWVIPASRDERRYAVFDVADAHRGDKAYFDAIGAQMNGGGLAAMIHEMRERDISGFDVAVVPDTNALKEQKRFSLDSIDSWLHAVIGRGFVWRSRHGLEEFGEWHEFCATELLMASYQQWCSDNRERWPASRIALGKRLTEIFGLGTRASGNEIIGEVESGALLERHDGAILNRSELVRWGYRPHGYRLGSQDEAREAFARKRLTGMV
jgi:hypothetical protein